MHGAAVNARRWVGRRWPLWLPLVCGVLIATVPLALQRVGVANLLDPIPETITYQRLVCIAAGAAFALAMLAVGNASLSLARARTSIWVCAAVAAVAAAFFVVFTATATVTFRGEDSTYIIGFGERVPACVCPANLSPEGCTGMLVNTTSAIASCWSRASIGAGVAIFWLTHGVLWLALGALAGAIGVTVERRRWLPVEGFERFIRDSNTMLDPEAFAAGLKRAVDAVCKIEVGSALAATGFLVGPDLVLTNYHVVEPLLKGAVAPTAITVRFDYRRWSDATIPDRDPVLLHATDWLVASSRYADDEEGFDAAADRLDIALLRLAGPAPPVHGSVLPRAWLAPHAHAFPPRSPLIIVQHPRGQRVKFAQDTDGIERVNDQTTRVRYLTNTEEGSSGSPCFDQDWNLVAIHHYGDPAWRDPTFNQGVPIMSVVELLRARGVPLPPPP